jgi:uncharacterized protein YcaQ
VTTSSPPIVGSQPTARPRLSLVQARRVALAAQGLASARPGGPVTMRHLQRVVDTVAVVQIDSVNVLTRSHYLPIFSRLGRYPRDLLDRATSQPPRRLVEYWAHEASFVSPQIHRLLRFRMARSAQDAWQGMAVVARDQPGLLDAVRSEVDARGPTTAAELERALAPDVARTRDAWGWNWTDTKRAVEYLFWAGQLSSAGRTAQFERRYDLPERVLPAQVHQAADPEPAEAFRLLVEQAARSHGISTEQSLRDYFRLRPADARPAIAALVEEGVLVPVEVQGWVRPGYLHRDARIPRRVSARALLSPFDSLIWERHRTQELFGFRYRLEIYTPAARRVHGYYVLPFLLGEQLVARVDLKAERRRDGGGALLVQAAWAEPGPSGPRGHHAETATHLAAELEELAGWLGLSAVVVRPVGDLAPDLEAAVRARG